MVSLRRVFGDDGDILRETRFQLLLIATLTGPLGPALLSPLLDSLTGPYGVSGTQIGLLLSAYTAPAIVIIPLIGVLTDRYGRKPLLVSGLVLFGVAGMALSATTSFEVALGLRLLQGVGGAGIVPVIITSLGDLYAGSREATAQGLRFSASGMTQAVFPVIAGAIIVVGWRYPILLYGIAIPIAVAIHLWFDEPATATATTRATDSSGGEGNTSEDVATDTEDVPGVVEFLTRREVLAIVLARAVGPFVYFAFLAYNSIIVVRLIGGTPGQAGVLVALASLLLAGGASQTGRITAFFPSRFYPLVGANVGIGAGLTVVAFAPSVPVAAAGILLLGASFGPLLSLYRSLIIELAPEELRGRAVSAGESLGRVGATAAPIAGGVLIGITEPLIGFEPAVRWVSVGLGVGGGLVGVLLVAVASTSPSVSL